MFDATLQSPMSKASKLLVLTVYRWTVGYYQQSASPLSLTYLESASGVCERQCGRSLKDLLHEGVLIEDRRPTKTTSRVLRVQMDPQKWGRYAPAHTGPAEPPSPVEGSVEEWTSSPVEGSDGEWTSSPPKEDAHKDLQRVEEEERANGTEEAMNASDTPFWEDELPFLCEAEKMLTEVDSCLVGAVGRAPAREVFRRMCDYCEAASPDLSCADRHDVCVATAERLDLRLTRKDIKYKTRYLAKVLQEDDAKPGDLIGYPAYKTLEDRNGPWPPEESRRGS